MTEVVLDASVVLKWFRADGERHLDPARALRATFERGRLIVLAPPLLRLEIVNVAGRRWLWGEAELVELAVALDELGFEFEEPELARVASWTARGLTAYDSAYVAVAEKNAMPLITDDDLILSVAGEVATALGSAGG
ncbi:MAG: type II toxin-antitoxin system VapC family toxin [Gaiellaceae bacterium]